MITQDFPPFKDQSELVSAKSHPLYGKNTPEGKLYTEMVMAREASSEILVPVTEPGALRLQFMTGTEPVGRIPGYVSPAEAAAEFPSSAPVTLPNGRTAIPFTSFSERLAAFQDARYDTDPVFRKEVADRSEATTGTLPE